MPIRLDDRAERPDGSSEYVALTDADAGGGPGAGRVLVRLLEPLKEVQGHEFVKGREPLVEVIPGEQHDPQAGPSITSDDIANHRQLPKFCEKCKRPAKGPGVTRAGVFGALRCAKCSDGVLSSFTRAPKGRPTKEHARLMAMDAERKDAE